MDRGAGRLQSIGLYWVGHDWGNLACWTVCCGSVAQSYPTLCNSMDCSTPGFPSFTVSRSLLKLMSTELVMPSNISSSVVPFFSCLQSFPASGSFPMSWLFASGGQSIGASALIYSVCISHLYPTLLLIKCHVTIGRVPVADTSKQPCEIRTAMCGSVTYVWDLHWFHIWPQMSDPGEVTYKCSCAEEWVWYCSRWIICTFFLGGDI